MTYPFFIAQRKDFWEDGWTYGDWRQYTYKRPDGQTQCVRISGIPATVMIVGFILLAICAMGAYIGYSLPQAVAWGRIIGCGVIGTIFVAAPYVANRRGIYLLKAVGPVNNGTRRVSPGEENKQRATDGES